MDGNRMEVKNCTELYRKNPTHYSTGGKGQDVSECIVEIFLHFSNGCTLYSKVV